MDPVDRGNTDEQRQSESYPLYDRYVHGVYRMISVLFWLTGFLLDLCKMSRAKDRKDWEKHTEPSKNVSEQLDVKW